MTRKKEIDTAEGMEGLGDFVLKKLPAKQQIIRATIRISKEGHDAISRISEAKKTKNAEVFSSILEIAKIWFDDKKTKVDLSHFDKKTSIRKTYVLQKDTFMQLAQLAEQLHVSRDVLINQTTKLLDLLHDKERQIRIDKYSNYLERVDTALTELSKIEQDMRANLPEDDPVLWNFERIMVVADNHRMEMDDYVFEKTSQNKKE
jgi:hypothetical protein